MGNTEGYSMRRLRIHPAMRDLVADVGVSPSDVMYPVFVRLGVKKPAPVASMPGVMQHSPSSLIDELKRAQDAGVRAFMLFGVVDTKHKDERGSHILDAHSVIADALHAVKNAGVDMLAAADVCFCEYTSHGHCGVSHAVTAVDNAATVSNLGKQAVTLAQAGADLIAPSGMMDGAVRGIRAGLDGAGLGHVPIMGYTVKYASAFYGPFRDAVESAPKTGNRKQYQQDNRRDAREALAEAKLDLEEGADILMVKPGLPYLDIVSALRQTYNAPVAAYHVSGEYAMLKAAAERGWIDYDAVLMETMLAFRRAGASFVLTYAAPDVARLARAGS